MCGTTGCHTSTGRVPLVLMFEGLSGPLAVIVSHCPLPYMVHGVLSTAHHVGIQCVNSGVRGCQIRAACCIWRGSGAGILLGSLVQTG